MKIAGIDGKWAYYVDDKLTFYGALSECYEECAKRWNSETKKQYEADYNDKIFPNLPDHDRTPIKNYIKEDYERAIQSIAARGKSPDPQIFIPYANSTIQHYRYLIDVVVVAASNRNLCDNVLWGSRFSLTEDSLVEDEIKEHVRLKKSLSVEQEIAISKELLTDWTQSGQKMGLLLMYSLGLRNGEACGIDFGDIRPMTAHPECKVLWVYKSTAAGTSRVQSSGKTKNADRIIPIPENLARFLEERKTYVLQQVPLDESQGQTIDQLPVACIGENFQLRCNASHLTAAGREVFKRIELKERMLSYIDRELMEEENAALLPREKDATSYLFRRNFGTHLYILGLSEAEIQYVLGHDIEDDYETRNEFVNEEKLYEIKLKMEQRPLLNAAYLDNTPMAIENPGKALAAISDRLSGRYSIRLKPGLLKLRLTAKEPMAALKIRQELIPQDITVKETVLLSVETRPGGRSIDILDQYHNAFEKKRRQ